MDSKIILHFQDGSNADFHVWFLKLREGISETYRAELEVISERVRTAAQLKNDVLGKRISITLEQTEDTGVIRRPIHGFVTGTAHEGSAALNPERLEKFGSRFPKGSMFRLVIEPEMVKMKFVRRTLDYPDTTPIGAVKEVFRRNKISPVLDSKFIEQEKYQSKVRFIQHDETDFDFLTRVLARYGISYIFNHPKSRAESIYLSDGNAYPQTAELEFSGFSENISKISENEAVEFSMLQQEKKNGIFRMQSFEAASGLGVEYVKTKFLHPAESRNVIGENGSANSGRGWFLSDPPAGYGENIDDKTLDNDLSRAVEATGRALRLARDNWHGETDILLPMPGKILNISGFYSAGEDDSKLTVKALSSELTIELDDKGSDNCRNIFQCMDFDSASTEKRFCPAIPAEKGLSGAPGHGIREALVCDRDGNPDAEDTRNKIVPSPHSTPEMPWIFLVRNENPESENKCVDVVMTMPLGGKRSGMYRFPRVGDRVLIFEGADRAVLLGYVPDKTGSFSEFYEDADKHARNAESLRYTPPDKAAEPDGACDEIGFSHYTSASEFMEQRIVDGSAYSYLLAAALKLNDQELSEKVTVIWKPKLELVRANYFQTPGKNSAQALSELAKDIVQTFELDKTQSAKGDILKLFSNGSIVQYSKNGIDITTDGELNISASSVRINGTAMVNIQSEGLVRSVAGTSSMTANTNGIALRSLRILDAMTNFDSAIYINAADGVTTTGGNLRFNGLFAVRMSDGLGASLKLTDGVFQAAGGAIDVATVSRDSMTEAFSNLNENSGQDKITEIVSGWQSGSMPGGVHSIADHGIGIFDPVMPNPCGGIPCNGNFRGTLSGLATASDNLSITNAATFANASSTTNQLFETLPGGNPNLKISVRELLRAKAFSQQLDVQRTTAETVNGAILAENSASVTIHGHQVDLNVKYVNDLSEKHLGNSGTGAGTN